MLVKWFGKLGKSHSDLQNFVTIYICTAQQQGKTRMFSTRVSLASFSQVKPGVLVNALGTHNKLLSTRMHTISTVLAQHTTSNLIVTD